MCLIKMDTSAPYGDEHCLWGPSRSIRFDGRDTNHGICWHIHPVVHTCHSRLNDVFNHYPSQHPPQLSQVPGLVDVKYS